MTLLDMYILIQFVVIALLFVCLVLTIKYF